VVKSQAPDAEALQREALALFERALGELSIMRAREGDRLKAFLIERLDSVERLVREVHAFLPEVGALHREKLLARLKEIKDALDPQRLEQEMVLFANRTDVTEELDRLASHVTEVRATLTKGGHVGRRLDFLMQEFNREANTLGAKSVDIRQTNVSVELKVLIEQMREQVQNIE
jgi:uncharacterized protein (TIGR00255 family)